MLASLLSSQGLFVTQAQAATNKSFCRQLPALRVKLDTRITLAEAKLSTQRGNVETKLRDSWSTNDQKKGDARVASDANKDSHFASIMSKATTPSQKDAVATFKNTITTAVATRRVSVDAAITDYRTEVRALYDNHKQALDSVVSTLKTDIGVAFSTAETDCISGKSAETIHSTFKNSVTAAENAFKLKRTSMSLISDSVKTLVATRNQKIADAKTVFESTIEQAKTTLKAAFPKNKQ